MTPSDTPPPQDQGVAASPPGHSGFAPSPDGLGHSASVPNADRLVAMMVAYSTMPSPEMRAAFPEYPGNEFDALSGMGIFEAVLRFFLNYAQAIEARRAETGTGSVHESAVGEADAPESQSRD